MIFVEGRLQLYILLRKVLRLNVKKKDFGSGLSSLNRYSLALQPHAFARTLVVRTIMSSLISDCCSKASIAGKHREDVKSRMISSGVLLLSKSCNALNPSLTGRFGVPSPLPCPPLPRPPLPPLPLPRPPTVPLPEECGRLRCGSRLSIDNYWS